MTQGSRSGAGRGDQRRQGPSQGSGRGQGPASSGRDGGPRRDERQGGSFGGASDGAKGGPRGGSKGKPAGSGKSGAGKAGGGKPGAKQGGAYASKGPRPFGNERFGRNLGPVARKRPASKPAPRPREDVEEQDGVRLQKVLANAGVASRRVSEEMIAGGRVEVDGEIVTELGMRVDPATVSIHVDGMRIQLNDTLKYFVFNKPRGVVSTMDDPEGRRCISDYVKKRGERLFHVGRLDVNTEGLLLLTNDGELANRLTHPSYEIPKTYLVQVPGPMAQGIGAKMKDGIQLEDGWANVDSFKLVDSTPGKVLVEVILHSGRNRVVRRLFDAVGHPVKRLVRVQMGPIRLGDQKQGTIRPLGNQEVGHLLAAVGM
ncbi:pseudouridine synthase [Arthrobacter sp. KK5.5]|uniref:pseudouridine synthase n=1 Tax=Arthrobacter sp. KK5.5 TaxID=3373084 RepID=UPI003EE803EB